MKKYFPKSYADSRSNFLRRANTLNGEVKSWSILGSVDQDLFVDYLWLAPITSYKNLLVLTSGIHGSECYAGAAVQNMFIDEILPTISRIELGILIVHSMNPFGFKNHQRTTENKVNLNRNFSVSGDLYTIKNEESVKLCRKYLPSEPVTSLQSKIFAPEFSVSEFTKATAPGQFESPEYLEYGGRGPEPQTKYFIELLQRLMPDFETVLGLDLHTGLGDRARLHLLDGGNEKVLNKELFSRLFDLKRDERFYTFTPSDTEGFYEVKGSINSAFGELAKPHQKICALTMEYGTLGHSAEQQRAALNGFLVDHQGLNFGFTDPKLEKQVKAAVFERSYPDDDLWRTEVVLAAKGLFESVLKRL